MKYTWLQALNKTVLNMVHIINRTKQFHYFRIVYFKRYTDKEHVLLVVTNKIINKLKFTENMYLLFISQSVAINTLRTTSTIFLISLI